MKATSGAYNTHVASALTKLAICLKLTRTDAMVLGFTSHDVSIVFGSDTYSCIEGYDLSDIATGSNLASDNLNATGPLVSPLITELDLRAGLWDFATFEIFRVNWSDISMGREILRAGTLGEVRAERGQFNAELRGLMQFYTTSIGELTSPGCRAVLGDNRCQVDLYPLTVTGTLDAVAADQITLDDAARTEPSPIAGKSGYFEHGKITFTSGANNGLSMEIKAYEIGVLTLALPMPYALVVGVSYLLEPGCDRLIATCIARFNNVLNFRGEPYLQGNDKLVQVGRRS